MNSIDFQATEEGIRLLASFIAQLIREGINFKVDHIGKATSGQVYTVTFVGY